MYDIQKGYELAKEIYAAYGVDVDKAIELCDKTPLSIHCWQGDDVNGFEKKAGALSGGIQVTGNYPGRAQTPEQLRSDMSFAFRFIMKEKPEVRSTDSSSEADATLQNRLQSLLPKPCGKGICLKKRIISLSFL